MKKAAVFLAEGFEEVEALTSVDLLRRAGIEVTMVAVMGSLMVTGARQITVQADLKIEELKVREMDLLILPGGMPGTIHLGESQTVKQDILDAFGQGKKIAAICAAPSVLGKMKILQGKRATCYPGFEAQLEGAHYCREDVVVDGNVITSRGVGTAISFALTLIELLTDLKTAETVQKGIVYDD